MNTLLTPRLSSRLLAGFGTLTLLAGIGLLASRPAHTAGGPIGVTVTNTPLATTPTDNPAKQGFQFEADVYMDTAVRQNGMQIYTIPPGKRLVIDSVNSSTSRRNDGSHYSIHYAVSGGLDYNKGQSYFNQVPDGSPFSVGVSHVQLYADAGDKIFLQVDRTEYGDSTDVSVTFAGHFVDIATPGGSS